MFKILGRTAVALVFAAAALADARGARAQVSPPPQATQQQGGQPAVAAPQQQQEAAQAGTQMKSEGGHEWAPLLEQKVDYKDWTFKSLKDGAPLNLRELSKGKKLVMVVYFAPWCGNWRAEAPTVSRLYEKYKADGFEVVAVSEYASADDSRKYFEGQGGAPFPVAVESDAASAREQTTHFGYRKSVGDARRWGSPFNVFLEPAKLNKSGEVLTERAWVVGGELIEKDVERFIRERLGLAEQGSAEPCTDEPKAESQKALGAKKP
ncbi:MAG TPA: TlpA disulfide reductase family protein [Pyrinomonadaceae bacterium]|jgi:thiol-disulfide isomerase/thioredoxin